MNLSYISITNYRSITGAYKIDMSNLTVLLGQNNEGKTNIIRAIKLGMSIIQDIKVGFLFNIRFIVYLQYLILIC